MVDGVGGKPLLEARVRLRADGSGLAGEAVSETSKAAKQAAAVAQGELARGYKAGAVGGARAAAGEVRKAGTDAGKQYGEGFTVAGGERIRAGKGKLAPAESEAAVQGRKFGAQFGARAGSAIQEEFRAQAGGLGKTLVAAFAADKGLDVLRDSVRLASDLNEVGSALNVTFGAQGATAVQEWSATSAKGFGLSRLAAAEASQQFGIFAKSAGLSGSEAVAFSTKLAGLAGDLTSFYNPAGGTEQAIQAIGAALRGESEPIRSFGVLLDDATLRQEALKLGITKTTKDALTPQQRVLAAYSVILKQTTDAQGDFARTSDSLANSQRTLGNEFDDLKTTLGQGLAPVVGDTTKALRDLFSAYNGLPNDGLAGKFKPALLGGIGQFSVGYNLLRDGIGKVSGAFGDSESSAKDAASAYGKAVTSLGEHSGAAGRAATATHRLSTMYDGSSAAAEAFRAAQDDLTASLTKSPFLDAREAARGYEAALDAAGDAAKRNGQTLDTSTEKGRENQEALDGLAESALSYLDSINAQAGPGKKFQAALKQQRADLVAAGVRFGLTRKQAEQYADKILEIPRRAVTQVSIANWKATYDQLTGLVTRVNQLDGRRVTVTASAANVREDRYGSSTGGPVPGRPSEVDSLPYMLAPGEYVIRSREASKPQNRAVLDAMNAGRDITGAAGAVAAPSAPSGDLADLTAAVRTLVATLQTQGPGRVVLDDAVVGRIVRTGGGLAGIDAGGW